MSNTYYNGYILGLSFSVLNEYFNGLNMVINVFNAYLFTPTERAYSEFMRKKVTNLIHNYNGYILSVSFCEKTYLRSILLTG